MQNKIWITVGVLAALVLIGAILLMMPTTVGPTSVSTSTSTGLSSSTVAIDDIPTIDVPDFNAPIQFGPGIEADVRNALETGAVTLAKRISENPVDLGAWINLGMVRKMGGDFKGAETAWQFVIKAAPNDTIARNNLGDLYASSMKDYAKAEQEYLTAIKLSPTEAGPYQALSQIYTNFYKKGTGAAEDILKKGVSANPESVDLHVLLARYYRSVGRTAEAKAQFDAAVSLANKAGKSEVAAQIRAEENQ